MKRFSKYKIGIVATVIITVLGICLFGLKTSRSSPNIIIIMIDTLRADHLGCFGYERNTTPNIDRLASESLNFKRAISASSWTPPSVTSILTGLYPTAHTNQPPKRFSSAVQLGNQIPDSVRLLPEMLKVKNYRTAAISSNPWISKEFNFNKGFDRFYYAKHIDAEKVVALGKKEVDLFSQDQEKPFFLYLHLIDPHEPYLTHADFKFNGALGEREYSEEMMNKINLYDGEIQYTDAQLGVFLNYLKDKKLYENTIIVLVSDHGEAFNEHGSFGHGFNLHIEEVHVPLIIKTLGAPGVVEESVSHVDIVPTLLSLVGINLPKYLVGQSLLDAKALATRSGVYSEVYRVFRQRAFSTAVGERLIVEMGDTSNPKNSMDKKGLYDLIKDPHELNSIDDPIVDAELRSYLESIVSRNTPLYAPKEVKIQDKTVEQLETLGYIN